jgi:hypothetical protein
MIKQSIFLSAICSRIALWRLVFSSMGANGIFHSIFFMVVLLSSVLPWDFSTDMHLRLQT